MYRTRQFQIRPGHKLYAYCNQIAYDAARCYNRADYIMRQYASSVRNIEENRPLHENQKEIVALVNQTLVGTKYMPSGAWFSYASLDYLLKTTKDRDYYNLPSQVNQQMLRLLIRDYRSFFCGLEAWKKDPSAFTGRPRLPRYKGKLATAVLTNQVCKIKDGKFLQFPKCRNRLNLGPVSGRLKEVRICPSGDIFCVEAVLEIEDKEGFQTDPNTLRQQMAECREPEEMGRVLSIDPGVNNFCAVTNNFGEQPFVIRGGVLKSVNQYYNKEMARLRSEAMKCNKRADMTHRMNRLTRKRNNRIRDRIHKITRYLADLAARKGVILVILGHNRMQKQHAHMGKVSNQNFVQLPFCMLEEQLAYKLREKGIAFLVTEEAYTSKADFLAMDPLPEYREGQTVRLSGLREKRGRYRHYDGSYSNADINGAANILRKVFPNIPKDGWNRGLLDSPYECRIPV